MAKKAETVNDQLTSEADTRKSPEANPGGDDPQQVLLDLEGSREEERLNKMSMTPMSTEGARRFCGHCGHEVSPQAGFCGTCGQTTAPPRPAPPPGAAGRAARRPWLIPAVVVLVLAAIAVPVVLVAHPSGRHGPEQKG